MTRSGAGQLPVPLALSSPGGAGWWWPPPWVRGWLLSLQLQQSLGYTARVAGLAFLPFTVMMLLLSSRIGALAQRVGPRWPMTVGPLVAGTGLALLVRAVPGASYLSGVLPGIVVFGLGMSLTVAPLTSTVLASVEEEQAAAAGTLGHDTAAATYAVPKEWRRRYGIRRYGFHGLSHAYCSHRAAKLLGQPVQQLRIITCHLGAGASLAAVVGGRSIDTTMGFTPLEGLVMATRSGSVDPGLVLWLAKICRSRERPARCSPPGARTRPRSARPVRCAQQMLSSIPASQRDRAVERGKRRSM